MSDEFDAWLNPTLNRHYIEDNEIVDALLDLQTSSKIRETLLKVPLAARRRICDELLQEFKAESWGTRAQASSSSQTR